MNKFEKLKKIIKKLNKVVIAYSGGVDSSFLLKVSIDTLGKENVIAVNAISPTYTKREREFAEKFAQNLGAKIIHIQTEEFQNENFIKNPPDRCFYCKRELFEKLEQIRRKFNFEHIIDGSNKDDEKDYRPGMKAKEIFNVISPLKEAGFTKKDIRRYSKKLSLPTWDNPALACLASRIPYGKKITDEKLKRIEKGEEFLWSIGFKQVRLRDYEEIARIEVDEKEIEKVIKNRKKIVQYLKGIGYKFVTVDLEGYRTGSLNLYIKK